MSSQIIIALACGLCAVPFCLIGYLGTISKTPLHFWNGDEKKLKKVIRDVPGYNRRMGAAYRWYGTAFLFCGLVGAFSAPAGIIGIGTLCPLGLWLLWKRHRRLLEEYS